MRALRHAHRAAAAARGEGTRGSYRFEDQANDILRSHVQRLDVHRRSVLLFYLVFGLIAGFMIGIVGARGAFATTFVGEPMPAVAIVGAPPLSAHDIAAACDVTTVHCALLAEDELVVESSDTGLVREPERYAALMWPEHFNRALGPMTPPPAEFGSGITGKSAIMGMLIGFLAVAAMLCLIFWVHLAQGYAPPRRHLRLGWPPA